MRKQKNPPVNPRTIVQYMVRFDAGPAIRSAGSSAFIYQRGLIEARNTLVKGIRDNKYTGTGYYELYDVNAKGRPVVERMRLSPPTGENNKWHWIDENDIPTEDTSAKGPKIITDVVSLGPKEFAVEARLEDGKLVGAITLTEDRSNCQIRKKLLSQASQGNSVGAWHITKAVFHPDFPLLPMNLMIKALVNTTGAGLASGPCIDGVPVTASGYDAKTIFESAIFNTMANVQEHEGYYVAFRRV